MPWNPGLSLSCRSLGPMLRKEGSPGSGCGEASELAAPRGAFDLPVSIFALSFFLKGEVEKVREGELSGRKAPPPGTRLRCAVRGAGRRLRPREAGRASVTAATWAALCPPRSIPGADSLPPFFRGGDRGHEGGPTCSGTAPPLPVGRGPLGLLPRPFGDLPRL